MKFDSTRERLPTHGFGWVDRRVLTQGHLARLSRAEGAVYLLLCVVGDRRGISYYSPSSLAKLVKHAEPAVRDALATLRERRFIAQEGRFFQVLPLEAVTTPAPGVSAVLSDTRCAGQAAPASTPVSAPSAEEILDRLPTPERERWLAAARAQLARFTGSREVSPAVVRSLAAGLSQAATRK